VLTTERAVSAVPFGGKYRIIDFVLSNCSPRDRAARSADAARADSLHDHIGSGRAWISTAGGRRADPAALPDGERAGWLPRHGRRIAQKEPDRRAQSRRVLVLSGDHGLSMDYRALVATHEQRHAALTLAVTRVPAEPVAALRHGTARRRRPHAEPDREARAQRTPFASMGILPVRAGDAGERLAARPIDLVLDVVQPMLEDGERVFAHEFDGFWEDVGTIRSFYRANLELLRPLPLFALYDSRWRS